VAITPHSIAQADSKLPATELFTLLIIEMPASTASDRTMLITICIMEPYFFFLLNMRSILCVIPKPPNTFIVANTMATQPNTCAQIPSPDSNAIPVADNAPTGRLAQAINEEFGSFEAFKDIFAKAGATLFGSGWAWLSADAEGNLKITQEPNAANPIQHGLRPLLTMDVWEHAYYLDYQNRRPDHLTALWQIIDWDVVASRYEE
jgi:hypothetical protein